MAPKDGDAKPSEGLELEDVRAQLDDVDRQIVEALAARERIVMEVARRKSESGEGRVRDPAREDSLLKRLSGQGQQVGLDAFYVTRVFREVIDHSVRVQQEFFARLQNPERGPRGELVVAYQGIDGAYSHLAAMRHFGPWGSDVTFRGYPTFRAMMEAVRDGQASYGILPIENTTAGSINDAYDLLAQMDLAVVGEEIQKVEHCLVAIDNVPLGRIRRIFSHPQALAQCGNFLESLRECQVEAFTDTAMAVQRVGIEQDLSQAAIASEEAANRYGLTVIKRDIANQKENYTRMVVVAARAERVDPRVACKTSLILATKHEKGALLGCLNALASRDLNLTKLESRPRSHTPWEYLFYLDFEGNIEDERVVAALADLRERTSYLRVLGSYPARAPRQARNKTEAALESRKAPDLRSLEQMPHRLTVRPPAHKEVSIEAAGIQVGGPDAVLIARLPWIASRELLLEAGRALRAAGASFLQAPCFDAKVREHCDSLGIDPLVLLEEVGWLAGIGVIAELTHAADVDRAVQRADMLVVPSLQMQNAELLHEVGRVDRPVILERGAMASIDEWLAAAELVLARGNHRVILCERGIRTFERVMPGTLDLGAVAVLRERTHLPILVDPSQAAGKARWAMALALGARSVGAHGVTLTVALDALDPQSLTIPQFGELTQRLSELPAR